MVFPLLLPLTSILGSVVPEIVNMIVGDDDSKVSKIAKSAASIVRDVTGVGENGDLEEARKIIEADDVKKLQLRDRLQTLALSQYKLDTERLAVINRTMRGEANSIDPWQRRWRPFWGFTTGFAFLIMWIGIIFHIFYSPAEAPMVISAIAQLTGMWSVALSVLGIAVWQRSNDKRVSAGGDNGSITTAIADRIRGK